MKSKNRSSGFKGLVIAIILGMAYIGILSLNYLPAKASVFADSSVKPSVAMAGIGSLAGGTTKAASSNAPGTTPGGPAAHWINNGGQLTGETGRLVDWLDAGRPLEVRLGEGEPRAYGFRSLQVTTDDFQLSSGAERQMDAEYKIYSGRELRGDGRPGESVSLAVVNGAMAMAVTRDGENFLVGTDPRTGKLHAIRLHDFDDGHTCHGGHCTGGHVACQVDPAARLASTQAPEGIGRGDPERVPVEIVYPGEYAVAHMESGNLEEPSIASAFVDHPYFRHGPQYNVSLPDITVLWASSKSETGTSSGLSARAAEYFSIAARVADIYERQLGLRYLLQELILVPSDSPEVDPGAAGTLEGWGSWLGTYRPQSTYLWGHAALWTIAVDGPGGVIGQAWVDAYGSSYGQSIQERNWGWPVHAHEMGHNVGADHTSGGIMNPYLISGTEDFFTLVEGEDYTAAKDIHAYMGTGMRNFVFGYASMRDPVEIPFANDDAVATPVDTPVSFNPLANDLDHVTAGVVNTLRLVEVGQVYPVSAGTACVTGDQIEFVPSPGYTGQAWFTYTLGGDVGNFNKGWLHSADVVVTVGGDTTAPTMDPPLVLTDDFLISDFSQQVRINPLLNDQGKGRLWPGDVHVVLGPNDSTAESYSDQAFHLTGAQIVSGDGLLTFEKRYLTRNGAPAQDYTGYISYYPNGFSGSQVVIEYTVVDGNGNSATGQIVISRTASVGVKSTIPQLTEDSGEVLAFTFARYGNVDLESAETVDFVVEGTATPAGLRADYALAGQSSFDPVTGVGTVVIPAGELEKFVYLAVLDDGVQEDAESVTMRLTGSSSLPISEADTRSTIYVRDTASLFYESFDSFGTDPLTWGGWSNLANHNPSGKGGEDWFDWEADSGSTPTANTGPSQDHTSGSGGYLLAEATGRTGKYTLLDSPVINVSGKGSARLEFYYLMYGSGMGTLSLELHVDGILANGNLWSRTGQQSVNGTDWGLAEVDLTPYLPAGSIQLRFRADIGATDLSDIAIDDVRILAVASAAPAAPVVLVDPAGCTAEAGDSVYLSVISEGFPAPRIQWLKDGAPISGATGPSYHIQSMGSSEAGVYVAEVSNDAGTTSSAMAEVGLPGGDPGGGVYYAWAEGSGLDPADMEAGLDPEKDGVINLLEFAFGMEAMVPDAWKMPSCGLARIAEVQHVELTYTRRIGGTDTGVDYSVDGLTYTVEWSSNLAPGSWVPPGVSLDVVDIEPITGTDYEQVTVRMPVSGGAVFLRVNVAAGF